ncbi:MAG: hypothetical protein WC273_02735 [Dehalococcoidia bacterium]
MFQGFVFAAAGLGIAMLGLYGIRNPHDFTAWADERRERAPWRSRVLPLAFLVVGLLLVAFGAEVIWRSGGRI